MDFAPRILRPVTPPVGLYFRPGQNDHTALRNLLSEERLRIQGVALPPLGWSRHEDLATEMQQAGLEVVLDPLAIELASPGGFPRAASLPWAGDSNHTRSHFTSGVIRSMAVGIAEFVADKPITAVLAPTHFLAEGSMDWLAVDAELLHALGEELERKGRADVLAYYGLALHSRTLNSAGDMEAVSESLARLMLDVDGIWVRVHPFGSNSGAHSLRRYIQSVRRLHATGVKAPIIADCAGMSGLALSAFGVVGGFSGGITVREHCDLGALFRKPSDGGFSSPPRVYLAPLGIFMDRERARALLSRPGMKGILACQDRSCCERGTLDMLTNPKRHFLLSRIGEVGSLSQVPEHLRAAHYLESVLRPATDHIVRVDRLEPSVHKARMRLESWRSLLATVAKRDQDRPATHSEVPRGRRLRQRVGA